MKERLTITLDEDLLQWLDTQISQKRFANRSHGIEFLITQKLKGGA